jgi:hypothetical protein
MQKFRLGFVSLACLGFSQFALSSFILRPLPAIAETTPPVSSGAVQRLTNMFSPEIQRTISACWGQGKVNLAVGAGRNGVVTCGDGSTNPVAYTDYVNTVSDILAASSLVGFKALLSSNAQISPQMLTTFLANSEGTGLLRNAIQNAITQSNLLPAQATASNTLLVDQVMQRILPNLQDPTRLDNLLGTRDQYTQVVRNFCTAPGMSVNQARTLMPGLDSLQLYAICIQESGVANEMLRLAQ